MAMCIQFYPTDQIAVNIVINIHVFTQYIGSTQHFFWHLEDKCIELTRQTTYKNVTGINAMKTKSLSASKPLLDELHSVFVHVNVSIVQCSSLHCPYNDM